MSLEKALGYLEKAGYREHVIQLGESTATVAMAAEALGVEPGRIAKTMSFLQGDKAVLIITEGTAKIDNRKYKDTFHVKAKMIPFEEVENIIDTLPVESVHLALMRALMYILMKALNSSTLCIRQQVTTILR